MQDIQATMWQIANNIGTMHNYRIYLLDANAGIEAADFFSASADTDAAEIASFLHDACSDTFTSYELWRGETCIASSCHESKTDVELNLEAAIQKHQNIIVDLEERLQQAFACVNRSRKLLDTYARIGSRQT